MNVIKRSGEEVTFDAEKIFNAVAKASKATVQNPLNEEEIHAITKTVSDECAALKRSLSVEEIQDLVET